MTRWAESDERVARGSRTMKLTPRDQSLLRVNLMLGARRHDYLKSRVNLVLSQRPGDGNGRTSRPVSCLLLPRACRMGLTGRRAGRSRVRSDHLSVIGASDDPPRSRSGLRGFGNTRRPPIVKMLGHPNSIHPCCVHNSHYHPFHFPPQIPSPLQFPFVLPLTLAFSIPHAPVLLSVARPAHRCRQGGRALAVDPVVRPLSP